LHVGGYDAFGHVIPEFDDTGDLFGFERLPFRLAGPDAGTVPAE
jgi:hypothetical protein